jgi:hypothetical protein
MSRETIIRRIVEREMQERGLAEDTVRRDDSDLHKRAIELFGTWETALQYAGINLRRIPSRQQYNRERVLRTIRVLCRTGYSLKAKDNMRRDYGLYAAALEHFPSWRHALQAAGIDLQHAGLFSAKPRHLKSEEILDQLRQWNAAGHSLDWSDVCLENRALALTAKIRFRSWRRALLAVGIAPESVTRGRPPKWNPDRIIGEIRLRRQKGRSLCHKEVRKDARGLFYAAKDYYGSWTEALVAAGCDLQNPCEQQNGESNAGNSAATQSTDTKST